MDFSHLNSISPFVRIAKIVASPSLSGSWVDYDNVLTYVEDGEADFIFDGAIYPVSKGDLVLVPPFVRHIVNVTSSRPLVQYITHFDLFYKEERSLWDNVGVEKEGQNTVHPEEMYFSRFSPVARLPYADRSGASRSFLKLYREYVGKSPSYSLMSKAMLIEMLILFLRNQRAPLTDKAKVTKGWAVIKRTVEYIQANYGMPELDNGRISWECGISSSHLSFIFKEQLGVSVHKYLNHVRIEEAKKLVAAGDDTLSVIAEKVGFASLHQLSKSFKKHTGVAPSQFMAVYAKRVEA